MTKQLLPGKISVTYPQGDGCDYVSIEVTDETSGVRFVEVHVKYAEWALALGAHLQDCEFVTRGLDLIGMQREHKNEMVFVPRCDYGERENVAQEAIAPFEVDGWKGRVSDALNHHNLAEHRDDGAVYKVTFVRWVK